MKRNMPVVVKLSSLRHVALWWWHHLLTLALMVLVLVAIVVGLGRQFMPAISDYREMAEARLSRAIGVPVRIEAISGRWQGMGPFILIEGLSLRDPTAPATALLRLPRLELRPSLLGSLLHLEPRVDLRIRGLDIHLEQLPDGRLRLRELASLSRSDPAAARRAVELALRQPLLALEDSRMGLALQGYPVVSLSRIKLVNQNNGSLHRLAGEMYLEGVPQALAFNLSLQGSPVDWQKGLLSAWLNVPAITLDAWLPKAEVAGLGLEHVTGGGEFWLHFAQGRLIALQARPRLSQAVFRSRFGMHSLQSVSAELDWHREQQGWVLAAQGMQARLDNAHWPVSALAIASQASGLTVAAADVDVATASLLANRLPLPDTLATWLREATPEGRISALRADLTADAEGRLQPARIVARLERLGAHATAHYPGARNLAGWLDWSPEQALLGLDARGSSLDLRQVFREPVMVEHLQGILRLQVDERQWRIESDRLVLQNADAKGQALLRVDIPKADPGAAELSLLARLTEARVASAWRYVPWPSAGDKTLDWLRRALAGGTLVQGDFLFSGPVSHRTDLAPLRQLMRFELKGATLDYSPGWPALRNLDGVLTIDGRQLRVDGRQADLLDGTTAQALVAEIPDLSRARLAITGEVSSTGPDLLRLFRESPLRTHTARVAEVLQLEGPIKGRLALDIPLAHGLPGTRLPDPEVEISAQLSGNRLSLPRERLVAEAVTGEVRFSTRQGLAASDLSGRLLGAPVTARMSSTVRQGALQEVRVNVDGRVAVPALQGWLGGPLWSAFSGETAYQASIRIPAGKQVPQLLVTSPMTGIHILLPAPLGKGPEALPLRYQSALGEGEQLARLQLGRRLGAGLVWRTGGLHAALLRLESANVAWPSAPGIEIEGKVGRLALADWQPWIDRFQNSAKGGAGGGNLPGVTRIEIQARELEAHGWQLANARLSVLRAPAAWQVGVSNDKFDGSLLMPDASNREWQVDIKHLHWPLAGVPASETVAGNSLVPAGPVRINAAGIRLLDYPGLGEVGVRARLSPSPYGIRVDGLHAETAVGRFDGRVDWQWRGGASTRLRGVAESQNVAGLLQALRYAPSLDSRQARADIDLSWPASPNAPSLKGLDGHIEMRLENGRVLNVNATTSASRVFGLFAAGNIMRRLKGDFSDVLRKGLTFDVVTLGGDVQAGQMPQAVFDLKGPSLSAHGEGRLDLVRQQIDQEFTVNVPVSSAVPLAAAVVAGPLIGGAVVAAEMVLKKQIRNATVLHYRISGDWGDPEVVRHGQGSPTPASSSSGSRP